MAYLVVILLFNVFFIVAQFPVLPAYYVEGSGTTLLGKAVLWSGALLFALAAALLMSGEPEDNSGFRHWYGLGMMLMVIDLVGVSLQTETGDLLNWVGRSSAYPASIYAFIAITSSLRSSGEWLLPIEKALHESESRYKALVDMSPDAILV